MRPDVHGRGAAGFFRQRPPRRTLRQRRSGRGAARRLSLRRRRMGGAVVLVGCRFRGAGESDRRGDACERPALRLARRRAGPTSRSSTRVISAWTARHSAEAAAETLQAAGVAAYPVVTMAGLFCRSAAVRPPPVPGAAPSGDGGPCLLLSGLRSRRGSRRYRRAGALRRRRQRFRVSRSRRIERGGIRKPIGSAACSIEAARETC